MTKNENLKEGEFILTRPGMEVVNRRLLCSTFASKGYKDPETGIWMTALALVDEKSGRMNEIPRFFVTKTANDLPLDPQNPEKVSSLPIGTEVFPFIPPAENFSFPVVFDPISKQRYTMLEWPEITGYILPGKE